MEEKTKSTGMVVIDSSVFIDFLREYPPAVEFFKEISQQDTNHILFSAITETELLAGKSCNNALVRDKVIYMLNSLVKINVNNPLVLIAGDICRKYDLDLPASVIAATALLHKATLLTRNVNDFKKVVELNVQSPY